MVSHTQRLHIIVGQSLFLYSLLHTLSLSTKKGPRPGRETPALASIVNKGECGEIISCVGQHMSSLLLSVS